MIYILTLSIELVIKMVDKIKLVNMIIYYILLTHQTKKIRAYKFISYLSYLIHQMSPKYYSLYLYNLKKFKKNKIEK